MSNAGNRSEPVQASAPAIVSAERDQLGPLSLCPEDLRWSGLSFEQLCDEELAGLELAAGARVHFHKGVWWKSAKPFFCRTLFTLTEVDHHSSWPHPLSAPLGFLHIARTDSPSNGSYPVMLRERIPDYSLAQLSKDRRYFVRHSLTNFDIRIASRTDLLRNGYKVYAEWSNRVQWGLRNSKPERFETWIARAFRTKHTVLAAYRGTEMAAFALVRVVGRTAVLQTVASHGAYLRYFPNDGLYHAFLCISRQTGVDRALFGAPSTKHSQNEFKLHYGSMKRFPCYVWINPLLRPIWERWRYRLQWMHEEPENASKSCRT
jgi:hypothetical protein